MKYPNPLNLSIKSLKTWTAREGYGWQFTLLADGAPVAEVTEEGNGGEVRIKPFITNAMRKAQNFDAAYAASRDLVAKLTALCETLPEETSEFGDDYKYRPDIGIYLAALLESYELDKKMACLRKKGTPFRLTSDPVNSYRSLKTTDAKVARDALTRQYGADGFVLL